MNIKKKSVVFVFLLVFAFIFTIIVTTESVDYFMEKGNEKVISVVSAVDDIEDVLYVDEIQDVLSVGKIEDRGDFYITYMPNPNSEYVGEDTAISWLKDAELLEFEVEFLNENFRLPYDVEIIAKECGFANALYIPSNSQIVICYEFVDELFETWYLFNEDNYESSGDYYDSPGNYAYDVLDWVLFHEVAHAIIHIYDLPVTGLEENAADQFASLMLSYTYYNDDGTDDFSLGQDMLYNVANYYWYNNEIQSSVGSYWDVHNLDIQRFYNISCYAYGSDPEYNQDLIEDGSLPKDRASTCEYEYSQIENAWRHMLKDFTNEFFD